MSRRLQVILSDEEMEMLRELAQQRRQTVAEVVRQALRDARQLAPETDAASKLQAVRLAAEQSYPTGDIEQMLSEIESGYSDS